MVIMVYDKLEMGQTNYIFSSIDRYSDCPGKINYVHIIPRKFKSTRSILGKQLPKYFLNLLG